MPSRWAEGLPWVDVPSGAPKPITFVIPYYENLGFLHRQLDVWASYPEDVRAHLSVILVDDGSPLALALPIDPPCAMRLFRIAVDVRWNWLAARNIGAHHARDGWLLLTDMDHVVPPSTAAALVYGQHDPAKVYAFSRREHTGAVVAPHSASFFVTRETFWTTGGYDEALSGYYGTDGEFRRRLAQVASFAVLPTPLIRYEQIGDASTTRYQRKQPIDRRIKDIIAQRLPGWKPKTLSFPYHEVGGC